MIGRRRAMDHLHWPLSVLNKAVHHKNLSGAAAHVGLSQPQLSRIVAKLEADLGLVLLDRAARRQSGWTSAAFKLAETYSRQSRQLELAVQQVQAGTQMNHVSIGALEGLAGASVDFAQSLLQATPVQLIELNVYDLSELEERFAKHDLDVAFTCREPGRGKLKHSRVIGYQDVLEVESRGGARAFSPYEHARLAAKKSLGRRSLISNSLAVRRKLIESYGASGTLPSPIRKKRTGAPREKPVYLLGTDVIGAALWRECEKFRL